MARMKGTTKKYNSNRKVKITKPKPKTSTSMKNRNLEFERGRMEGLGIFKDIGKWLSGANKWLKKSKVISKAGPVIGNLVGKIYPSAGKIIGDASKLAAMAGYGISLPAGGGRKIKNITPTQQQAMMKGYGRLLKTGGISLALAKKIYPQIKNITPGQWKAIQQLRARNMKGGGYRFVKGVSVAPTSSYTNIGNTSRGKGIKLAGQGPNVSAGSGYKKKRRMRRKPGPMKM